MFINMLCFELYIAILLPTIIVLKIVENVTDSTVLLGTTYHVLLYFFILNELLQHNIGWVNAHQFADKKIYSVYWNQSIPIQR